MPILGAEGAKAATLRAQRERKTTRQGSKRSETSLNEPAHRNIPGAEGAKGLATCSHCQQKERKSRRRKSERQHISSLITHKTRYLYASDNIAIPVFIPLSPNRSNSVVYESVYPTDKSRRRKRRSKSIGFFASSETGRAPGATRHPATRGDCRLRRRY